ncbi:DUF1707 domain-containing protein [Nocardia sp. NPDC127579]|uniref:DUF1707 SHOCT-like domain-containing protein n=1 Tax=Nocardia sp. NPDC127579 TaxID=3345402 RepID=UPI0036421B69
MAEEMNSRIDDADRERALRELSEHLGTGRLSLAEFDERSAVAFTATSMPQLAALFTDLPGRVPIAAESQPRIGGLERSLCAALLLVGAVVVALLTDSALWLIPLAGIGPVLLLGRRGR